MTVTPGSRIGSYEIIGQLGAGGMGEVYRARDTKLKRDVAIKVLPAEVAGDPERLARFQREAEVLASLNHPHIAHVYGFENPPEGGHHLVMELVEGEDLSQRIARGPIPIDEALPVARQIAEALEAAHDAGIIHRDLKPGNIKVRDDGTVKVLDFGLAKALDPVISTRDLSNSPTITSPAMTGRGVILGTAAYMSPEQAKGKAVDKRADIWAFGCVLYEMLSGRRAFRGEDTTETIADVLKSDVDMTALPVGVPGRVIALLQRCLQRDSKLRLRDIGEARVVLGATAVDEREPPGLRREPRLAWGNAGWILAGVLGIVAAVLAVKEPATAPQPNPVRFAVEIRSDPSAAGLLAAISPDGTTIAAQPGGATDGIYLRRLDGEDFVRLEGTLGFRGLAWSADSRSIAALAQGELRVRDLTGSLRTLAKVPDGLAPTSAAWGSSGDILVAFTNAPLHVLRAGSSTFEPVGHFDQSVDETEQSSPVFHPDGRRFFYLSHRAAVRQLATRFRSLDSGEIQELAAADDRVFWADEQYIVFRRGTTILGQRISYAPLALQGSAIELAHNVEQPTFSRVANASVSRSALIFRSGSAMQQFVWYGRDGQMIRPVGPAGQYPTFALSRDGSHVATTRRDNTGQNIWIMDGTKGTMNRATIGQFGDLDPRFGPDGRAVMFASTRETARSPHRVRLGGQPPDRVWTFPGRLFALDDWSADGNWMLYHDAGSGKPPAITALRLDRVSDAPVTVATGLTGILDQATMSRDGRWVAYNSTESGRSEVYVVPFPPTGDKWQVSVGGGAQPMWRSDGRELYFLTLDGMLMSVQTISAKSFKAGTPVRLFRSPIAAVSFTIDQYVVAPDGSRFLFAPYVDDRSTASLTVLLNWQTLLEPRPQH
ncbi:MAG TPA: protein kinase [Vicinamibacterales bacterium]|nr:protein kinase [Vicinamibacterales bacterium]